MRLALDPRAWRLLRRLPRTNVYSLLELVLLSLLAIQCARLVWALVTPVDPLGNWRIASPLAGGEAQRLALFRGFDPFFRLQGAGQPSAVVTSLQLQLFGVRVNEATGQGSAIIAGPDNVQNSYAVGDEIMPGVTLQAVTYDGVTISRGGTPEQLFVDQSVAAPVAAPDGAVTGSSTDTTLSSAPGGASVTPTQIQAQIQFLPRLSGGRVTGVVVRPQGSGEAFRVAGLREGDVIVAVNGRPVSGVADLQSAAASLPGGGNLSLNVERGSEVVPIAISVTRQ